MINIMIGQRIKSARKLRQRSQKWLAEEVGVTQSSVSEWETGKSGLTVENLSLIAQLLNVNFEWLATGRGEMHSPIYRDNNRHIHIQKRIGTGTFASRPAASSIGSVVSRSSLSSCERNSENVFVFGSDSDLEDVIVSATSKDRTYQDLPYIQKDYSADLDLEKNSQNVQTRYLPILPTYTREQRKFLELFEKLPKSKREVLLTFMRDWVNLK